MPSVANSTCGPFLSRNAGLPAPRRRKTRFRPGFAPTAPLAEAVDPAGPWWEAVLGYGPDHPALVGTAELAAALGIRPQTVRVWRMRRWLPPAVLVAGRLRYLRRDIRAWALAHGFEVSFPSFPRRKDVSP